MIPRVVQVTYLNRVFNYTIDIEPLDVPPGETAFWRVSTKGYHPYLGLRVMGNEQMEFFTAVLKSFGRRWKPRGQSAGDGRRGDTNAVTLLNASRIDLSRCGSPASRHRRITCLA